MSDRAEFVTCPECGGNPKRPSVRQEGGSLSCRHCNRTQTFNFMRTRGEDCQCERARRESCGTCLGSGEIAVESSGGGHPVSLPTTQRSTDMGDEASGGPTADRLRKIAAGIDGLYAAVDQEYRCSGDPPNPTDMQDDLRQLTAALDSVSPPTPVPTQGEEAERLLVPWSDVIAAGRRYEVLCLVPSWGPTREDWPNAADMPPVFRDALADSIIAATVRMAPSKDEHLSSGLGL